MQCSRSLHCFEASIIIIIIIITISILSSANAIQDSDMKSYIDREHRQRQRHNSSNNKVLSSGDVRNTYNINDSFIEGNEEATNDIIYSKAKNDDERSLKNMFLPEPRIINGDSVSLHTFSSNMLCLPPSCALEIKLIICMYIICNTMLYIQAPERRYPYAASLQYNRQHFCGGSLVAPNIVITAAHCTTTPTKITLGRYDLDDEMDFDYEIMGVTEKIIHPDYDKTVVENDRKFS